MATCYQLRGPGDIEVLRARGWASTSTCPWLLDWERKTCHPREWALARMGPGRGWRPPSLFVPVLISGRSGAPETVDRKARMGLERLGPPLSQAWIET